ncbi:MAG TPA: hypothetical protein PKB10_06775, partial [Tepidisphaeraceae bacterium]|nr:hypothetical protein [Tepidisphaeraceae bacterium]
LVTAWGRGDRPAATRACRDVAASIERLVTHRDIQAQIAQSQHGPHLRPMIDQLLELARPRAEEMNLTMAAMRMWSMLRERAVRSDPTRSQE